MREDATKGAERESVLTKVSDAMDYIEPFLDKFPRPEKGYAGLATRIRMSPLRQTLHHGKLSLLTVL